MRTLSARVKITASFMALTLFCALAVQPLQAQRRTYRSPGKGEPSSGEEAKIAKTQERIQIEMIRSRDKSGPSYDEIERIKFVVKLTNKDLKKDQEDLEAVVVLVAQNVVEKKKLV